MALYFCVEAQQFAPTRRGAMKVLFVRHAQSLNNAVQGRVQQKLASGCSDFQGAQSEWLLMRHEDPPLSDAGR